MSKTNKSWWWPGLWGLTILLLLGGSACSEEAPPPETAVEEGPPEVLRARAWADRVLDTMSLPTKIGQLVLVEPPETKDSLSEAAFAKWLDRHAVGGILVRDGEREQLRRQHQHFQTQTRLPLWTAFRPNAQWRQRHDFPSYALLGATDNDSLVYDWGAAIGQEARYLKAHMALVPAALTHRAGFSTDPERVQKLGEHLINGIYDAEVLPVVQSFEVPDSTFPEIDSLANWQQQSGQAIMAWVPEQAQVLQSAAPIFTEIDTVPLAFSRRCQKQYLREQQGFEGLLLSPDLSDSLWLKTEDAAQRALLGGADLVLSPGNLEELIQEVGIAVEEGKMSSTELDEKVWRNLYKKALLGLDTLQGHPGDTIAPPSPALRFKYLDHLVTRESLVLLRDEHQRVPLKNVGSTKIATLHIGSRRRSPFQSAMNYYTSLKHHLMPAQASAAQLKTKLQQLAKFNYVFVALDPEITAAYTDSFPAPLEEFLLDLQDKTRLVVTNFGNPANLNGLDSIDVVLHACDNRPLTQWTAGQFLFGAFPNAGKMPYAAASFELGQGLATDKKLRLAFSDPEALGVDPEALTKVDSIVRSAIYLGAFPGCQVLAAKDGEVFFQKAYGWHDYTRAQKVRSSDVYDIASITKIAATTLMAMWSYDQDSLGLDLPLKSYLTSLDSSFITIKDITPAELLIHKAGLPPSLPVYKYYTFVDSADTLKSIFYADHRDSLHDVEVTQDLYFNGAYMDSIWNRVRTVKLVYTGKYKYSDLSMFLLKYLLEEIHQTSLDKFVRSHFYSPMGLQKIGFLPLKRFEEAEIVPTENDRWWRHGQLRGYVHDQSTALLGGIGGQAGLFSNAQDLAVLMQMLLNRGHYGGTRYLNAKTVGRFTSRHPNSHRGLGFDMQKPVPTPGKGMVCQSADPTTFGHTGFTGTCAWADPKNDVIFIFLSNRIYPTAKNKKINIYRVRQHIQQALYEALQLVPKEEPRVLLAKETDTLEIDSTMIAGKDSSECETC